MKISQKLMKAYSPKKCKILPNLSPKKCNKILVLAPKKCKIGKYGTEKATFEQDWMTNIPLYAVCVI